MFRIIFRRSHFLPLHYLSQHTPKRALKECHSSLFNVSKIDHIVCNLSSFNNSTKSKENKDYQLGQNISIILVSKFHQTPFNFGLIPKFTDRINTLTGILLHSAVLEKRLDIFHSIIDVGAHVEVPNRHGRTPLYEAIENRQYEMISTLLKHGADPNFSFQNISLIHNVISAGDLYILQTLIELGAVVDKEDFDGKTPLYSALISNKKNVAKKLLEAGANVNFKSISGKTLLYKAAFENRPDTIKELIKLGAKVDEPDDCGITPLYVSLMSNNSEITELLIANGANINFVSNNGNSLLHTAVSSNRKNVVDLLLNLGSDQMMTDREGLTPLYRAIKEDNLDIINSLVKNPNVLNKRPHAIDDYPVHFAVTNGTYSSVKLLLENGANRYVRNKKTLFPLGLAVAQNKTDIVNLIISDKPTIIKSEIMIRDLSRLLYMAVNNGNISAVKCLLEFVAFNRTSKVESKSVLSIAVEKNDIPMVNLLVENGANVSTKNEQGDSLLHTAVSKEALEAVKALIELGLDVEATNNRGLTPLLIAISINSPKIIRYLVCTGANVNRKLKNGDKPLLMAISNGTFPTVNTLIELGAEIENNKSLSAIEKAVEVDRPDIIKILVAKGVPLRYPKISLLHLAAESGSVKTIRTLLNMGIPIDSKSSGYTPLWLATKKNRPETMEVLLQNGANINEMCNPPFSIRGMMNASWSLIHEAVYRNLANATLVLLKHGLNPNSRDFRLWTPLHYAAIMNNIEIADILIKNGADIFATTKSGLTALGIVSYSQEASKQEIINLLKSYGERLNKLNYKILQ